jgi:hypothetical protein
MTETPDDHPRPAPRPRAGSTSRPSPRARVAGARRDRDEPAPSGAQSTARRTGSAEAAPAESPAPVESAAVPAAPTPPPAASPEQPVPQGRRSRPRQRTRVAAPEEAGSAPPRRGAAVVAVLAVLCLLAAAGTGLLLWQRLHPSTVDSTVFTATRSEIQSLYAFDYHDANGSISRKLAVLTGSLHDEYKKDLSQGGIIDSYKQVSATTSYDVLDVGLEQINDAQDAATLVVFGQYVVKSVNTSSQKAPAGSECQATPDGGQSCTQTVKVGVIKVKGAWKINEVTLITSS